MPNEDVRQVPKLCPELLRRVVVLREGKGKPAGRSMTRMVAVNAQRKEKSWRATPCGNSAQIGSAVAPPGLFFPLPPPTKTNGCGSKIARQNVLPW